PPANSSIDFQMLLPIAKRPSFERNREQWGAFSFPTFVALHEHANPASFGSNLKKLTDKYMGERFKEWRERGNIPTEFEVASFGYTSLNDVHLNTKVDWTRRSDPKYSYVLGSIAALILLIAAINYISLALTTSTSRRVEV